MIFLISMKIRSFFGASITLMILSLLVGYISLGMNVSGFEIPLTYSGDGLFTSLAVKGLVDNPWIFENDYLGFPFGSNLYGFPSSDSGNFILLKLLSFFTKKYQLILNAFILMSFPLNALTSFWFFIKHSISTPASFVGAFLFAFLPFHFLRIDHTFLIMYFSIPVFFHFGLRIIEANPIFFDHDKFWKKCLVGFFLLGMSCFGVYFSFFGVLVFIVSGILGFFQNKKMQNVYSALTCIFLIGLGVLLNIAPNLYLSSTQPDIFPISRAAYDTETFGLKFSQMILPRPNHRLEAFSRLDKTYNYAFLVGSDLEKANFGLIGAFGFLLLVASWFVPFNNEGLGKDFLLMSKISLFLLLFSTTGGFGSIFSLMISPQIRALNRVSIFLAFSSLFTVLVFMDVFLKNYRHRIMICLSFLFLGLWDQTGVVDKMKILKNKSSFNSDAQFIKLIENKYPRIGIYQLPYVAFPESADVFQMTAYEHFKGYLHSRNLKWNYACFRGTDCDLGFRILSSKPITKQIMTIKKYGFKGIYINRSGFEDEAFKLENDLKTLLGEKSILISPDATKSFFYLN